MGKSILIITLGVSIIIGFIILKLNTNATSGVETTINKFDQTHARLIANSSVEIQLEILRRHKEYVTPYTFSGNLFDGSYSGKVDFNATKDTIIIRATGLFQEVQHFVKVEAERKDINPPALNGAMRIITNAFNNLTLGGQLKISGFDHDTLGLEITNPTKPDSVPGITVDTDAQRNILANKNGGLGISTTVVGDDPKVLAVGSGIPAGKTYSIDVDGSYSIDWVRIAQDIAASRDTTLSNPIYNNFNIGTLESPKIVVVEGNVKINSQNSTGAGILVVNGNLSLEKLTWKGLIIAYKSSDISFVFNGGATVIGGMILVGDKVSIQAGNGGFNLLYSSLVMNLLHQNLVNSTFKILSWWE